MKEHLGPVLMVLAIVFIILFSLSMISQPSSGHLLPPEEVEGDLPAMALGPEEAEMMKNHLITHGDEEHAKGYWYYSRTYDGGKAKPPGIDEYYDMEVHILYVPEVAPGFNIGIQYTLREGKKNEYGDNKVRKVIQYHLDDADEDLLPNSMIRAELEFHWGVPVKMKYESVDAMFEWRYWVYYWYGVFLKEGMK